MHQIVLIRTRSHTKKLGRFPATSGHNMLKWGNKLLVRGRQADPQRIPVIALQVARGGHPMTSASSKLIMFGGEDRYRRLLNDFYVLDLEIMIWNCVGTKYIWHTPPAPRYDHTTAVHVDRYLQISGGCSHLTFYNNLSQPQI